MAKPARISKMVHPLPDDHPLRQSWPLFLDLLGTDLDAGLREFSVFAYRVLHARPPKILRSQTTEEREDWVQEIILHFTQDGGRVLREYRNTGHPFAAWFITAANHKAHDLLRRTLTHRKKTKPIDLAFDPDGASNAEPQPDVQFEFKEVVETVRVCLRKMKKKCQILLQAAAEEFRPREMLTLLGKDARTNKQVSDDLRECRKKLTTLLAREGIDLERLL
jgi:RNA polymerase sigma factor (sigma-70 family)